MKPLEYLLEAIDTLTFPAPFLPALPRPMVSPPPGPNLEYGRDGYSSHLKARKQEPWLLIDHETVKLNQL